VKTALVPIELRIVSIVVLALFLIWVVRLVSAQRLSLRDSLVWVLTTLAVAFIAVFPGVLVRVTHLLGFQLPSNALFGLAILYLAVNVLVNTVAGSQNAARIRRLSQEYAALRAELESLRGNGRVGEGSSPARAGPGSTP
jgi:hypothetical protein